MASVLLTRMRENSSKKVSKALAYHVFIERLRIIAQLEAGTVPWKKPWTCAQGAISRSTGKPYSVLNQLLLPYDGEYVTFKQAAEEGHPVKKGEKASAVFFFKFIESEDKDTGEKKTVPLLKYCQFDFVWKGK